jgi:hypothetical protein
MDEKEQDFCTDCESRRTFLGKWGKRLGLGSAALALAGTGIFSENSVLRHVLPTHRAATDEEILDWINGPAQQTIGGAASSPERDKAIELKDVEYFRGHIHVPTKVIGKAAAICGYCYCYQYENRASSSCGGTSCWCYPKCLAQSTCAVYYPAPYRLHCGGC